MDTSESPIVLAETESQTVDEDVVTKESAEVAAIEKNNAMLAQRDILEDTPVMQDDVTTTDQITQEEILADLEDVVVVESPTLATSSGLAVGSITTNTPPHAGGTLASIATQPNELLEIIYLFLTVLVVSLLGTSIVVEARKLHFQQVAYGFFLLFGMAGLWYAHSLLTTGAVIV
jgi:hypothetical protein